MRSYNVTSAGDSAASDRERRFRAYFIMMSIRLACVISLFWVRGWWMVVAVIGGVVLPYLAVLIANQPDYRSKNRVEKPEQHSVSAGENQEKEVKIIVIHEPHGSPTCSRASCSNAAEFKIMWRNPKIHDSTREKIWLACSEHKEYLSEYLRARNFPVSVQNFEEDGKTD